MLRQRWEGPFPALLRDVDGPAVCVPERSSTLRPSQSGRRRPFDGMQRRKWRHGPRCVLIVCTMKEVRCPVCPAQIRRLYQVWWGGHIQQQVIDRACVTWPNDVLKRNPVIARNLLFMRDFADVDGNSELVTGDDKPIFEKAQRWQMVQVYKFFGAEGSELKPNWTEIQPTPVDSDLGEWLDCVDLNEVIDGLCAVGWSQIGRGPGRFGDGIMK
eukprot:gene8675-38412_t